MYAESLCFDWIGDSSYLLFRLVGRDCLLLVRPSCLVYDLACLFSRAGELTPASPAPVCWKLFSIQRGFCSKSISLLDQRINVALMVDAVFKLLVLWTAVDPFSSILG